MNISASKFKSKCLQIMDDLQKSREEVIVTKRGRPVAKLVPLAEETGRSIYGFLKGSAIYGEDLVEPTGESWEADE
jgi:prevent-host-death family protein